MHRPWQMTGRGAQHLDVARPKRGTTALSVLLLWTGPDTESQRLSGVSQPGHLSFPRVLHGSSSFGLNASRVGVSLLSGQLLHSVPFMLPECSERLAVDHACASLDSVRPGGRVRTPRLLPGPVTWDTSGWPMSY